MAIGRPLNLTANVATKNINALATADQTSFTVAGGYRLNELGVYRNGARLIEGRDYTAIDGSTVTLLSAAALNDVIEFTVFDSFNVADAITAYEDSQTINGDLNVGAAITMISSSGIVSATKFYGDGSNISNAGSTLAAASGSQRVVVTSLTSGTMTSAATDSDLAFNASTNTLSATTFSGALTGNVTGNASGTAGGLSGTPDITVQNITGVAATFTGVLTYEDVTNVDSVGMVTARGGLEVGTAGAGATITSAGAAVFAGITSVGVAITMVPTTGIVSATTVYADTIGDSGTVYTGDGSGLSGVVSGIEVLNADSSVGSSLTAINFSSGSASFTSASSGFTTITISSGGIDTTAYSPGSNTVVVLGLGTAQYHELTLTAGITTITSDGGTQGEAHSLVLIQPSSGIATVGFSSYFFWPSGAAPVMSPGGSKIDLVSFVVKNNNATAGITTQLLASAGLNYLT